MTAKHFQFDGINICFTKPDGQSKFIQIPDLLDKAKKYYRWTEANFAENGKHLSKKMGIDAILAFKFNAGSKTHPRTKIGFMITIQHKSDLVGCPAIKTIEIKGRMNSALI